MGERMAARGEKRGGVERERRTAFDKSEFVYLDQRLDAHVGSMPFEVIDAMTSIEKKEAVTRIMEDIVQKGQVEPWCATRLKKAQRATTTGLISPLRHQIRDRIWTQLSSHCELRSWIVPCFFWPCRGNTAPLPNKPGQVDASVGNGTRIGR